MTGRRVWTRPGGLVLAHDPAGWPLPADHIDKTAGSHWPWSHALIWPCHWTKGRRICQQLAAWRTVNHLGAATWRNFYCDAHLPHRKPTDPPAQTCTVCTGPLDPSLPAQAATTHPLCEAGGAVTVDHAITTITAVFESGDGSNSNPSRPTAETTTHSASGAVNRIRKGTNMNEIGRERPTTAARPPEHCKECGRLVDDYVTNSESEDGRLPVPRYTCRDCGNPLEWRRIDRARALGREHLMRTCRGCGLLSDEYDFFYEGVPNGYVGRSTTAATASARKVAPPRGSPRTRPWSVRRPVHPHRPGKRPEHMTEHHPYPTCAACGGPEPGRMPPP